MNIIIFKKDSLRSIQSKTVSNQLFAYKKDGAQWIYENYDYGSNQMNGAHIILVFVTPITDWCPVCKVF